MSIKRREPDYLDELIRDGIDNDPGFAEGWAPYAMVGQLVGERTRLGLSQRAVAERMGVAQPVIARLENNPEGVALARILAYAKAIGAEIVVKPSVEKPKKAAGRGRPGGRPSKAAA